MNWTVNTMFAPFFKVADASCYFSRNNGRGSVHAEMAARLTIVQDTLYNFEATAATCDPVKLLHFYNDFSQCGAESTVEEINAYAEV